MTRRERAHRAADQRDAATRAAIVELVQDADPSLDPEMIAAAVMSVAAGRGARTRLLKQLRADRSLLTSGGSRATLAVCRLAAALRAAGATAIVLPRCACCGQGVELVKRDETDGICAACFNRARVTDCGTCGRRRRIAGREPNGAPICSSCRVKDPARHEACTGCGKVRPVNRRGPDGGALCSTCAQRTRPAEACDRCEQPALIVHRGEHGAICRRCYRAPRRRCGGCGRRRRIAATTDGQRPDLCPTCHWAPIATCTRCGNRTECVGVRDQAPRCFRCLAADRLDELLGDSGPLLALRDAFLAAEQPRSIHSWLDRSPARHVARRLATGELSLTHAALDGLEQTPSLAHLRALLVAVGTLPDRDPHLARLEHAIALMLAQVDGPEHRRLLRAFATWRILHRVRRRAGRAPLSVFAVDRARTQLVQAHDFLRYLAARRRTLQDATQRDVDRWLASGPRTRAHVSAFLNWATDKHHAPALTVPAIPTGGTVTVADPEARWTLARRLLHDEDLDPGDRVAGALVVIYAQPVARIARLRTSDIALEDQTVYLRFAHDRVLMPDTLGQLVRDLPHRRQVGPSGAVDACDQWLFPGRHAGQPQHPGHLARRLATLGIDCRAQRTAALLQLAAEVPAAVLADILGLTPRTAVRWATHAGGNWTTYAARRAAD